MGRKSRHTIEEKVFAVKKSEQGIPISTIALEYDVNERTIRSWIKKYRAFGEDGFVEKQKNSTYSKEFKEMVISAYLDGKGSYEDLSLKYGIGSNSVLINWVRKYNNHIETQDYNPVRGAYMIKSRKTTLNEREEIVKYCLKHNKSYTETAEYFNVSYAQVYNWVKKYETLGIEGLEDRRGKNKDLDNLSDIEKLERKVKQLERQLELKERETTLLKKVKEIERRRGLTK